MQSTLYEIWKVIQRPSLKWDNYFEIYERHFARFVNQSPLVFEIGVAGGGSLQMWKQYFGNGRIVGIDRNQSAVFDEPGISVEVGNQRDRAFLASVVAKHGDPDIVIDDGGHRYADQKPSFLELFPVLKDGGVYMIEDLHCAYQKRYGYGEETFIHHARTLIDQMNAFHSDSITPDDFTKSAYAITFHPGVCVIEKRKMEPSKEVRK